MSAGGCFCGAVVVLTMNPPWPGDYHVCRACGCVLIFDGQRWRPATIVEILLAPPEEQALLAAVSRAVMKLRSRTAGAGGMVN